MHLVRPFQLTDAPAVSEIRSLYEPFPIPVEGIVASYEGGLKNPSNRFAWYVTTRSDGYITGHATCGRSATMPEGQFRLRVYVRPECQRQGAGRLLYDVCLAFATANGATELQSSTLGGDDPSYAWALRRGFELERQRTESVLDLTGWDHARWADDLKAVRSRGITFLTTDLDGLQPYLERLYRLEAETVPDLPGHPHRVGEFDSWHRDLMANPLPRHFTLALDGEAIIGQSVLVWPTAHQAEAYTLFTCVLRSYRSRGIALALKLTSIEVALAAGATAMRTNNDPDNPSILRVNEKLGYRPISGPRTLRLPLKPL